MPSLKSTSSESITSLKDKCHTTTTNTDEKCSSNGSCNSASEENSLQKKLIDSLNEKPQTEQQLQQGQPVAQQPTTHYYEGLRLAIVQLSLNMILFIAALDIVIVTSAIEKISEEFHDYSKSAWLITGYALPNAVCCLIWSRLSQKLGKKLSVALAVTVFEIGSLVVAVANSMNMLIGGRVVAGIGGSGIQTLMFVVGTTLVPEEKRPLVLSLLSFSFTVSSVVGPFIGGAFTNAASGGVLSWRWCFYINLPIGFVALLVFYIAYDDHETSLMDIARYWKNNFTKNMKKLCGDKNMYIMFLLESLITFDMIGFLSSASGYVLTLLAFTFSSSMEYNWKSGLVIAFLVVGILLIIFSFVFEYFYFSKVVEFLERRFSSVDGVDFNFKRVAPLFPKVAMNNRYIVASNATAFFVVGAYGFQANYIIQYFQLIFNDSALKASIHFIPFMVSISIVVFMCGFITSKTGWLKPFIMLGGISAVVGNALISTLDGDSNMAKQVIYLIIAASGFGFVAQSTLLSSQSQLDKSDPMFMVNFVGVTATNSFSKTIAISFGSVLSTMIFNLSAIDKAKKLDPPVVLNSDDIVSYVISHYSGPTSAISKVMASSIHNVFYVSTAVGAIALVVSVFSSNKTLLTKKKLAKIQKKEEELAA